MTINVDIPPVEDEQEALYLMLYHLKLAAMYFEATPLEITIPETHSQCAIRSWLASMESLYSDEEE